MVKPRRRSILAVLAAAILLGSLTPGVLAAPPKIPTTLSIEATPNPAWVGENVTITFRVTPIPDGGEITLGGPGFPVDPVTGTAVIQRTFTHASDGYVFDAWYTGTDAYDRAFAPDYPIVVRQHPVTAALDIPHGPVGRGDPFDITVDLDEAPDGGRILIQEMTHGDPGPTLKYVNVTGAQPMTISMPGMDPGDYNIRAFFEGTDAYAPATSSTLPLTVTDRPTTTTLTSAPNPSLYGQPIDLSVAISPVPDDGGNVRLEVDGGGTGWFEMDWSTGLGTATLGPILEPGAHTIKAVYLPTGSTVSRWAPSSGSLAQTVSSTPIEDDPPVGTVLIDGGAEYSASGYVVISMHATDASGINATQMSCDLVHWRDAGTDNGDWGWGWGNGDAGCDPSDGLKTIYVRWRDRWGTWGGASDSIILDWNAPTGELVVEDGAPFTEDETISVQAGAVDGGSGVDVLALSNDGTTWTEVPYAPVVDWSLGSNAVAATSVTSAAVPDGVKVVHAKWRDANGHWSNPKVDTIILDRVSPTGVIAIADGAAYTKSTSVNLSVAASDAGTGVSQVAISNDGANWTTRSYAPSQSWTLPAANGTRTVFVKWLDGAGHWSTPLTDTIVLDQSAPLAGPIRGSPVSGSAISASRLMTRLSWSGSDTGSGVAQYQLQQSTDGGAWSTISTTLTSPRLDRLLAVQHTYAFRVRAVDWAGNVGGWVAASARRLTRYSETSVSIRYSGPWTRTRSSVFWNGGAKTSSTGGDKATFTFTGRSVAFVSRIGPTRGKARIYLDGALVATVDLFASLYQNQRVAWSRTFASSSRHTVVVKVLGTAGRPRVDVDAFVVAG